MKLRPIPVTAQRLVPWKDGGGTTREVAIDPPGADTGAFRWRVSLASVSQDGPFSRYPGVDRRLWLVRGGGLVLSIEGRQKTLARPLDASDFRGEAAVSARLLDGPTEDLNLMIQRGVLAAWDLTELWLASGERRASRSVLDGQELVLVLRGCCAVTPPGGEALLLREGDALRVDGAAGERTWTFAARAGATLVLRFCFARV